MPETPVPVETDTPQPEVTETPEDGQETGKQEGQEEIRMGSSGFTDFDSSLIAFLEDSGLERESFMVSPLSFRAALALAVSGAEGETKQALFRAMGFDSMEEVVDWYAGLLEGVSAFQEGLEREKRMYEEYPDDYFGGAAPDRAYSIANSVWHNSSREGGFRADYIKNAGDWFDALASEAPGEQLAKAVNDWVNEKTNGMIPSIAGDLSEMEAVLVNALYLRSSWVNSFSDYATHPGDFTTVDGDTVKMDFMTQQETFGYYEDEDTQLVILPMKGDINAVFVLGSTENILDKLDRCVWEEVIVTLPKFELETSLDQGELVKYLDKMGAGIAMTEQADFSAMAEGPFPWCIGDIIQKSKIKVDEDGIEAAAVTAIMMEATAMEMDPPQPKVFTADRPFSFYLYHSGSSPQELLFYGQYMK